MEYRVLELLAFARNNVVTRAMLLKHLYRRADDQPQPKIIDVFISKLRKKLRSASRRGGVHRDDSAARLDPPRHRREAGGLGSIARRREASQVPAWAAALRSQESQIPLSRRSLADTAGMIHFSLDGCSGAICRRRACGAHRA